MAFDFLLGVRVTNELRARYLRLARQPEHRGRDVADLYRIALEDYCDAQEKLLRMKPITAAEIEEMQAILADRARITTQPRPPKVPVNYRRSRRTPAPLPPDSKS